MSNNDNLSQQLSSKVGLKFNYAKFHSGGYNSENVIIVMVVVRGDVDDNIIEYTKEFVCGRIEILSELGVLLLDIDSLEDLTNLPKLNIFPNIYYGLSKKSKLNEKDVLNFIDS